MLLDKGKTIMKTRYGDLKAGDKFTYCGVLYLMTEAIDVSTACEDDEYRECCVPISIETGKYNIKGPMVKGDDTLVKTVEIKETRL